VYSRGIPFAGALDVLSHICLDVPSHICLEVLSLGISYQLTEYSQGARAFQL